MPPAWQVSGFTEIRELGSGASGRVVMARRDEDGGIYAIKYLSEKLLSDEDFLVRFRQEARLLEMVDSPQIARFYQYIENPHGAAIIMELIDGVSLRALIRSQGPTGPEAALVVLKGALLGLSAAHNAGVVHRDFKPENVLVQADGMSKLVDFGVAGRVGEGHIVGTPPYMAPEQWMGAPATPATDVYAATVVFFECLTGTRPFRARHIAALAHEHQTARPPIHEIPPPLQGLVERGMAKLPSQRPPSAQAFIDELEDIAARAYGPDWEHRGHRRLATLAGLLALHFPQAELIPHGHTTLGETLLDGGHTTTVSRTGVKIALGIGCVLLIGTVGITLVNTGTPDDTSVRPRSAAVGPVTTPTPDLPREAPVEDLTASPTGEPPWPAVSTPTSEPTQQPTRRDRADRPVREPVANPREDSTDTSARDRDDAPVERSDSARPRVTDKTERPTPTRTVSTVPRPPRTRTPTPVQETPRPAISRDLLPQTPIRVTSTPVTSRKPTPQVPTPTISRRQIILPTQMPSVSPSSTVSICQTDPSQCIR